MRATLMLLSLLITGPAWGKKKDPTVQERYDSGVKFMKRGYYVKALEEFNRIRNYYRDDPLSVRAELAIADVYFKKAEWDQARLAYEEFARMHPRHEELDYVTYRLGMTAFKKSPRVASRDQTWTRQAVHSWTGFEDRYPDSEYRDEVAEKLDASRQRLAHKEYLIGEFYVAREAWPAVAARMEGVLTDYPDSSDSSQALALLALAQSAEGEADAAREAASRLATDYPDSRGLRMLKRKAPDLF